jgi:hypothetical protein
MRNIVKALRGLLASLGLSVTVAAGMAREAIATALVRAANVTEILKAPRFRYDVECVGPDGTVKWRDSFWNLVTTPGKNDLLTQYFKGSAYTAAWAVGLIDNTGIGVGPAATDTMAAHAGWSEFTGISNATRPVLTLGTPAAGSVDNSASKASFTISAAGTVFGAFTSTSTTKGGATGVLYSAGGFAAPRAVGIGDTLNVQVTLSV